MRYETQLDGLISEWAEEAVRYAEQSDYSSTNVLERILHDPGITTGTKDRVMWWPRNRRISKMSKAMHQVDPIDRVVLIVKSGMLVMEDGNIMTFKDLVRSSSMDWDEIKWRVNRARQRLNKALRLKQSA